MTATPESDDQPDETHGGSTTSERVDNDRSDDTDNTRDELDAPDPA